MASAPLVRGFGAGTAFAYRKGCRLGVERFLWDVTRLAASLPDRRYLLNLCADRYHFAVGFAAALLRRQVSLLPPNETPDLIERLVSQYPGVYCLSDRMTGLQSLETVLFPELDDPGTAALPIPDVPETQVAAIVFTSGSTGEPVPYRKTWGSLARVALAEIEILHLRAWSGMALIGTVPPQHVFGLESTVLMAMQGGFALHARRPFYPADIRAELASLPRPRGLVTAPVHLRVLLAEADELPPADFLLCATAPLSPQLAAQAEARFAAPLYEIYGCTESGGIASRRTIETGEWRAMKDVTLRTDGNGTWVKGGHVEVEVPLADVIELRGRGRFLLHGRTADMVNIAGKRTSLAHLNYHLNSIEGVLDGVFVAPEEKGEAVVRLTAFVVAPGHTSETLMEALRQRIDPAFLPRPLCFVDVLPRNATGKVPRQSLNHIVAGLGSRPEPSRP
jgi:acyl-coenzyme A synthetase/AMP-(fatty) acid ligase